jgi:hypothetical protein
MAALTRAAANVKKALANSATNDPEQMSRSLGLYQRD